MYVHMGQSPTLTSLVCVHIYDTCACISKCTYVSHLLVLVDSEEEQEEVDKTHMLVVCCTVETSRCVVPNGIV